MDINNLSKQDTIWLALFVSFVTAIITGIVVVFLYPESRPSFVPAPIATSTPEENEQISTSSNPTGAEPASSTTRSTSSASEASPETPALSRDEILEAGVAATARISGSEADPQVGVLLEDSGQESVYTPTLNASSSQALFEDGAVAQLQKQSEYGAFSKFSISEASGRLSPLLISSADIEIDQMYFVVPASAQPQIFTTTVTSLPQEEALFGVSAENIPTGSLLLDDRAGLIALKTENGFQPLQSGL